MLFAFFCFGGLYAQSEYIKNATELLKNRKYEDAKALIELDPNFSKSVDALLIRGISNYFISNLKESVVDLNNGVRIGTTNPLFHRYLGLSYYGLGYYEEAAANYRIYLSGIDIKHHEFQLFKHEIYRCEKNLLFKNQSDFGFVENLGKVINSTYDEIRPVQSPNILNKFYFSTNRTGSTGGPRNKYGIRDDIFGQFAFDMYAVEQEQGNWLPSFTFTDQQNTSKNEILQSFNGAGSAVVFLKFGHGTGDVDEILVDTFSVDQEEKPAPISAQIPINIAVGDKDIFIYNDSLILFSSKRKGGFGGYDVYVIQKVEGIWSKPINLGADINSAYDEVSPFLTKGSKLLFFSSNRLEGFGGFDLFYSPYSSAQHKWEVPSNLGPKINSPMDDKDLFVSRDGTIGMFSSNRYGGFGKFDIYQVYFKEQVIDQLEYTEIPMFLQEKVIDSLIVDTKQVKVEEQKQINVVKREIINIPLYPNDQSYVSQYSTMVKNIKDVMLIYPKLEIVVLSSKSFEQNKDLSLYQSVRTAEGVANDILKNSKIAPSRITVLGLGSNLPIVDFENLASERLNNRVEIIFLDDSIPELKIIDDPSIINNEIIGDGYFLLQLFKSRLTYTVPFAIASQMLTSDLVKNDNRVIVHKKIDEANYTYSIGFFKNYQAARAEKSDMLKKNMLNARVKPFLKGRMINDFEIEVLSSQFSDLLEYKKYEILD
jgi:outer membrane protein OmpA-like peptidoglycan-associated protein/tetratricopeptide (TPR) repeat protein